MNTTLTAIPINSIEWGDNDRQSFDSVALEELSESIRTHGLVQPITIRPMPDGHYQIVAGERRWRACKLLSWLELPAIVRDLDEEAASAIMLVFADRWMGQLEGLALRWFLSKNRVRWQENNGRKGGGNASNRVA